MKKHWLTLPMAAVLILGACSDDDDSGDGDSTTTEAATDATTTTAGDTSTTAATDDTTPAGGAVEVGVGDTDLGQVLVDADGMTLYLFENDSDGVSTCNEGCVDGWPPLLGDEATAGDGVTAELSVITRDDGTMQVAANGMPLYRFGGDSAPGDANGQEIGDVWYAVAPDGSAIGEG